MFVMFPRLGHQQMALQGGGGNVREGDLVGESRSMGMCFGRVHHPCVPGSFLCLHPIPHPVPHEVRGPLPPHAPVCTVFCLTIVLQATEPVYQS